MAKTLIYRCRTEGSMRPVYHSCEVYDNGEIITSGGSRTDDARHVEHHCNIPKDQVVKIAKLIDDNSGIFAIRKVGAEYPIVLDGTWDEFYFSDGQRKNTLGIDSIWAWSESDLANYPDTKLLVDLTRGIRKILEDNGIDLYPEDY